MAINTQSFIFQTTNRDKDIHAVDDDSMGIELEVKICSVMNHRVIGTICFRGRRGQKSSLMNSCPSPPCYLREPQ